MEIELRRIDGTLIFKYKSEDNSTKKTLIEYFKLRGKQANLRDSNLSFADLSDSNFSGANFSNANLSFANFSGTNLSLANFSNANLSFANFSGTNLSLANFSNANLAEAKGIMYADCSFAGHGECGRRLLAVKISGEIKFFCGCFRGDEKALREYIEENNEQFKASRIVALETVLKLIKIEHGK